MNNHSGVTYVFALPPPLYYILFGVGELDGIDGLVKHISRWWKDPMNLYNTNNSYKTAPLPAAEAGHYVWS